VRTCSKDIQILLEAFNESMAITRVGDGVGSDEGLLLGSGVGA